MTPLTTGDDLIGIWQILSPTYEHADTGKPVPSCQGDKPTGFPPLSDDGSADHHLLTAFADIDIR